MSRPLLVGLQNPLSDDPRYALYPEPEGCTGWHLAQMLAPEFSNRDYLRAFDRVNLLRGDERVGGRGYRQSLGDAGLRLVGEIVGRKSTVVLLLGTDVCGAVFGWKKRPPWLSWVEWKITRTEGPIRLLAFPHPSGRNRWYNRPGNREAAAQELRRLANTADNSP